MAVATKKKKAAAKNGKVKPSAPAPVVDERPVVLGLVPKGDLEEVELDLIKEPPGEADRIDRPGDAEEIAEVARSLREVGQLQPVMVESIEGKGKPYFVRVFGRRRIAAARLNKAKTILAIVVPPLAPDVRRTIVAVENIQRKDLSAAEEHLAVAELLELQAIDAAVQIKSALLKTCGAFSNQYFTADFAAEVRKGDPRNVKCIQHDLLLDHRVRARAVELVAAMLAKTPSWVRDRMYVGRLGERGRALVLAGKLPLVHAREICKVADPEIREDLAESYAAGGDDAVSDHEAGELDKLKNEVSQRLFNLKVVPWKLDVPFTGQPACEGCPHNSATNPGLFEHGGRVSDEYHGGKGRGWGSDSRKVEQAVCTDHRCYARKLKSAKAAITSATNKAVALIKHPRKKGEKPVARAQAVRTFTPTYLSPAAIEKRVESKLSAKSNGSRHGHRRQNSEPTSAQKAAQLRQQAESQLMQALRDRTAKLEPKIAAALAKKPGAWALFKIFTETKLFASTRGHQNAKGKRAIDSPAMHGMLQAIAAPSWEGLVSLEKDCGRSYRLLDAWYDGPSGIADRVAAALGIEVDPPPTLEDFLPKSEVEAKPAEGGKGKSKRGRAAAAAEPADDEDREDMDVGDLDVEEEES